MKCWFPHFKICFFYTVRVEAIPAEKSDSPWQKTPVANLMRHKSSGNYYARIRVSGKLIWKSLKTDTMSVAKLRLGDFHKSERQRAEAQTAVSRGKMTFDEALQTYRERLKGDHSLMAICGTSTRRRWLKKSRLWTVQRKVLPLQPESLI
jgi:hypothetical protein